ncbi:nucleotide-binding universal stress UspA family protein [Deinobacterium chartae]|uniref:Nucleotide-binding universal stress UspA family protein n=1 Tax=Deinobacterium chartae TaxID=521158 RepID=A0A841I0V3_9DEIO|nr:universal stress protein [Deinobacterium chartae]MBB6097898.1 nucleotide-binding universal stress UspA family protein [Deinobacterium chartae]
MFDRILVTTDGSVLGNLALPYAADLARRYDSVLTLLYVVPQPPAPMGMADGMAYAYDYAAERERLVAAGDRILEEARQLLDYPQTRVLRLEDSGLRVAQAIAAVAEREATRLVVMSTHGRTGLAHLLLGSVAEGVLHRVGVPVLLVRAPAGTLREPAPDVH